MRIIPELNAAGLLPHDIELTLDEIVACEFVTGHGLGMHRWDESHRRRLAGNLCTVVRSLWAVGFTGEMGVDGSFVEQCARPRDIDLYCVVSEEEMISHYDERLDRLNALEGEPIWEFDEDSLVQLPGFSHPVSPLCRKYRIDLRFDFGQPSGFTHDGRRLTFREAFRVAREFSRPKGVIRIIPDP